MCPLEIAARPRTAIAVEGYIIFTVGCVPQIDLVEDVYSYQTSRVVWMSWKLCSGANEMPMCCYISLCAVWNGKESRSMISLGTEAFLNNMDSNVPTIVNHSHNRENSFVL
jgi:hypothetical protein